MYAFLPYDEFLATVISKESSNRFVYGYSDFENKCLVLLRGDSKQIIVPFSFFSQSGDGTTPDFSRLSILDYGHTISFGEYEASADSILYAFDSEYRKNHQQLRDSSMITSKCEYEDVANRRKLSIITTGKNHEHCARQAYNLWTSQKMLYKLMPGNDYYDIEVYEKVDQDNFGKKNTVRLFAEDPKFTFESAIEEIECSLSFLEGYNEDCYKSHLAIRWLKENLPSNISKE